MHYNTQSARYAVDMDDGTEGAEVIGASSLGSSSSAPRSGVKHTTPGYYGGAPGSASHSRAMQSQSARAMLELDSDFDDDAAI